MSAVVFQAGSKCWSVAGSSVSALALFFDTPLSPGEAHAKQQPARPLGHRKALMPAGNVDLMSKQAPTREEVVACISSCARAHDHADDS